MKFTDLHVPIDNRQPEHIPALDGLRGYAAISVVAAHLSLNGTNVLYGINLRGLGKTSVWLFFVMSAFLLTNQALQARRSGQFRNWLPCYFVTRFFRIYPLFLCFVAVLLFMGDMTASEAFDSLALVSGYGVSWSIPPEFQFYFLIPALAWIFCKATYPTILLVVAASIGISLFCPPVIAIVPYLATFVIGSLAAVIYQTRKAQFLALAKLWPASLVLVVILLPVFTALVAPQWLEFRLWRQPVLFGFLWLPVIAACCSQTMLARFLCSRLPRLLGRISFSLYFTHLFVFTSIGSLGLAGPLLLVVCCGTPYFTYYAIEAPGIRLGARACAFIQTFSHDYWASRSSSVAQMHDAS